MALLHIYVAWVCIFAACFFWFQLAREADKGSNKWRYLYFTGAVVCQAIAHAGLICYSPVIMIIATALLFAIPQYQLMTGSEILGDDFSYGDWGDHYTNATSKLYFVIHGQNLKNISTACEKIYYALVWCAAEIKLGKK